MSILVKRPLHVFSSKLRRRRRPVDRMKEKWIADFATPEKSCFTIKPEIAYNAYLEKRSLVLGLKKKNCMAWLETADRVYVDQIIDARFRFDGQGGHCASGIMFHVTGQGTCYLALVSSKGCFRLDAVHNNIPQPLTGWIETPGLNGNDVNLRIIVKGGHFIFLLNGKWVAEADDASIPGGHLGFALASYDAASPLPEINPNLVCQSRLHFLSVDARPNMVAAEHKKWSNALEISAESRLRLAESFAALDQFDAAYNQILKAWKQREEAARSVTATYTDVRTGAELLFAAQMTLRMGQYTTAEAYLNTRLVMGVTGDDALTIGAETAKLLSAQNKNEELAAFLPGYIKQVKAGEKHADIPPLYALLGHAFWNLQDYKAAANAWGRAFSLDTHNGLYKEAQALAKKQAAAVGC
jgi:tetratricopeptide (TPR) repeat protein